MSQDHEPTMAFSPFISKSSEPLDLDALVIEAERVTLRPITMDFVDVIFREFTPEITRYMGPKSPEHIGETRGFITEAAAQRRQKSDLILVILHKESEEFLGVCGLHARKVATEPEFGVWLKKAAHGNGYGREAIQALHAWAVETLEVDAFVYPVDKANVASRRIPESLGGVVVAERKAQNMSGNILDEVVYRIGRDTH